MSSLWHRLRFRLDHRWTPRHMSSYLDAELAARARTRVERHTAECRDCRSALDDLRHMLALLQRAPAPQPTTEISGITSAVLLRLHEPAGS